MKMQWWTIPLGLLVLIVTLPTLFHRSGRGDLGILILASDRLWRGEAVYQLADVNEHTKPPLATFAFTPLAHVSQTVLFRFWDLLNFAAFFFLMVYLLKKAQLEASWRGPFLGALLFLVLNPFNAELRLGQYNLLLLTFAVWAGFEGRSIVIGIAYALAVLFKPTFVLLGPWLWKQSRHRIHSLLAGAGVVVALALGYGLCFGFESLVADLQTWILFLPQSSAKHLGRSDNHGLPSALRAFMGDGTERGLILLALGLAALAVRKLDDLASLAVTSVLLIVVSPMAWTQNYIQLIPALVWAFREKQKASQNVQNIWRIGLVILWLGIGALNPTTCVWMSCDTWSWQRAPLWALLVATALAVAATRLSRSSVPENRATQLSP